jgi:hypothetical protein
MGAYEDLQAQARIYATEQLFDTVGFALARYQASTGLCHDALAERLGITLAALADLAQEARPRIVGIDGSMRPEWEVDRFVSRYHVDRRYLLEIFALTARGERRRR